jgi:hypothetical protein
MKRAGSIRCAVRGVAVLAAGVLLVAACSSGDDDAVADRAEPAATTPDTTAPPAVTPASPADTTAPAATTQPTPETTPRSSVGSTPAQTPSFGAANAAAAFPVGVSENKRYLVDQDGRPWMMNGDSPQCMSANLSVDDMEYFFTNRARHGFNAAWVNLICGPYTHGRDDASTYDGIAPFTDGKDLTTPNPKYWERMDTMVELAQRSGITLVLDPAETGSFAEWLKDKGADKSRAYGRFLGERYRDHVNIIWMLGNDYGDWPKYDEYVMALSKGIRDADPAKLQTVEFAPPVSKSHDNEKWLPLINLDAAYSYTPTYDIVRQAYTAEPTMPTFMVEANYEFENNTGGPETTDVTMRRQEWWTMTSGATGQLYGNKWTWGFEDGDWKEHFDTKAVAEYTLMAKFFGDRAWQDLVPVLDDRFVTQGAGDASGDGDVLENDHATAAVTPDGSLAIVYVPTARTIEVATSTLQPNVTARWFDPTDGSYRDAKAPFKTPGKNAAGDEDWVLVFEQPS